jgi:SAM-dependent methyltransferase
VQPRWLRVVEVGASRHLFDDRTGRALPLRPEVHWHDDPRVLAGGFVEALDLDVLIPKRKLHPLFLPERGQFLLPDPSVRSPGGHPWRAWRPEPASLALWARADGRRTARQIADLCRIAEVEAEARFSEMAAWPRQLLVLRPDRLRDGHPALATVVGAARAPNARNEGMYADGSPDGRGPGGGATAATALGDFHEAMADADTRFDLAETTLAHALGLPHPALGGRRYGAAVWDAIGGDRGAAPRVLEVGPGTGELAEAALERAARLGQRPDWLRVDRAPALLAAQDARLPATEGRLGDALALPVESGTVDLLVANEVMADLPSEWRDGVWHNVGALAFLGEVARVLAPGGRAFLSEFGSESDDPEETEQLDHPEVSIRFDCLVAEAARLGLRARLTGIAELLWMKLDAEWLWRPHLGALRTLDALAGRPPTAGRAWNRDSLVLAEPVEGLRWVTLHEEGPGPLPARMFVLVVDRG